MIGPSATEAFQWYIKDPIPDSVKNLKLKYSPHMRGYWIWLSFEIDPSDLDLLFDFQKFSPALGVDQNGLPLPLETFRSLDPGGFDEMSKGEIHYFNTTPQDGKLNCTIVISKDQRKVYYYRFRD